MIKNKDQTPEEKLYQIVEEAMCIGCGICQGIAGSDVIHLQKSSSGFLHPHVMGTLGDTVIETILDVCPSMRVESLPQNLITPETRQDRIWGPYLRVLHGWASNLEERFEGSSGGVLTELAIYLLKKNIVDFILHAKSSVTEPIFGERHLSFTRKDVLNGAGSRYGPTAPLIDINQVLDRDQSFAFIGKPCDITALRNYARHNPRVNRQVKYWLSIVCGGFMPTGGTKNFLSAYDVELDQVASMRYRGRGFPGPTRVRTKNGRSVEATYYDFWGANYDRWPLPHRCKICPDSIGEGADIIAADPWPGGGPDLATSKDPGTNVILVRTPSGLALLESAQKEGALEISNGVSIADLNDYQPHQVARKYAVWARFLGMKAANRLVPQTTGLRIEKLAQEMDAAFIEEQKTGMQQRLQAGEATEPRPSS
jgi:coenzyme F420 hydrogenase subunit beta